MKKLLIFILAMTFSITAFANDTKSFTDVKEGDWYYSSVQTAVEQGFVNGYTDGTFRPNNNITIAELVTMFTNYWGIGNFGTSSTHWAEQAVQTAYNNGWISTIPTDYDQVLSRVEVADIIYNVIGMTEATDQVYFTDTTSKSVNSLYELGIINGKTETTFDPDADITRAEISTLVVRVINLFIPDELPEELLEEQDEVIEEAPVEPEYSFTYPTVTINDDDTLLEKLYKAHVISLMTDEELVTVSYTSSDLGGQTIDEIRIEAYNMFYQDYPEFYTGYGHSYSTSSSKVSVIVNSEAVFRVTSATEIAEEIINGLFENGTLNEDMSDHELAEAMFIWQALNYEYDQTYSDIGRDAYGFLVNGTGVCSGYASAYSIFCNILGIDTLGVASASHSWSCIYIDNRWTYVDVTFGDPITTRENYYNIDYFDISKEDIQDEGNHKYPDNYDPYTRLKYTISGLEY